MKYLEKKPLLLWWLGIGIWTLINLLQAGLTELDPDEAYYWMYAHQLDWGYFDHPPAVAVFIRLGTVLFDGELGVRLGTVILLALTAQIIWILADRPRDQKGLLLLLLLLFIMPMFQVYGFIATPDAPLLFTTALFFLLYKRFLNHENWMNALALGIGMALLLYSKYHGILVIGFTVLSNFKLWTKPWFYLAGFSGVLLFFPHLWWQFQHDFPSFRYHLVGRDDPYELKYTLNYLVNVMVIFNPFLLPLIVSMLWKYPIRDKLDRAFSFIILGFVSFFFLSTFKGHAEPQWNALLSIPIVIMLFKYSRDKPNWRKWITYIGGFSIVLFLIARIILVYPLINIKSHFHNRQWVEELENISQGAPLVFQNSYREASKFNFYSDQDAYTFTDINYRQNQYDLWDWEKVLHNESVLIVGQPDWDCQACSPGNLTDLNKKIQFADSLQITQKITLDFWPKEQTWTSRETVKLKLQLNNPYDHPIDMQAGNMPPSLVALFFPKKGDETIIPLSIDLANAMIEANNMQEFNATFVVPDSLSGTYQFGLGIRTGDLLPRFCSPVMEVGVGAFED